ncbi:unnamed protein product [Didymodactylos carnosus]|uniref:Bulb-type lectin domain-containing protein n=1 Tax=Didymodactylos carnosus TaxID=1234261 RepID=A0A815MKW7_9BILA|nr:unnamed protein product [Didymodactylos carnosus]CAF1424092.1 unnamed protein product [Didymodactylos carnosus]CAF3814423.1 unnamed protein product [Didymodactylos carnosus]CAF4305633.1 unnamed protein product [Didymodactylos carnosus]
MQHLISLLLVCILLSTTTTAPVIDVRAPSNILRAGDDLQQDQFLASNNGAYYAVLQGDGDFVVYVSNHPFVGPYRLFVQTDGNIVLYDTYNRVVWNSQTGMKGTKPHFLAMQDDGNLVLYDSNGQPTWSTGTGRSRQFQVENTF